MLHKFRRKSHEPYQASASNSSSSTSRTSPNAKIRRNSTLPFLSRPSLQTSHWYHGHSFKKEYDEPGAEDSIPNSKDAASENQAKRIAKSNEEEPIVIGSFREVQKKWLRSNRPSTRQADTDTDIPLHLRGGAWPCTPTPCSLDLCEDARKVFVHVLYELILSLLLLPKPVAAKLMASQTKDEKRRLIKQHRQMWTQRSEDHTIRRNVSNGQSGTSRQPTHGLKSSFSSSKISVSSSSSSSSSMSLRSTDSQQGIKLDTGMPLLDFESVLCESLVRLRTADRVALQQFVTQNGQALFEMLNFCAFRKPCGEEEMAVIVRSLQCLDRITDNNVGIGLVLRFPTTLVTLALCARCELLPSHDDKETPHLHVESVKNAILSLSMLVRLLWGLRGGSRVLMQGGALYLFKHDYENASLANDCPCILVELCLVIFTFLNSLIELEDVIQRRDAIRVDIHRLQLLLDASKLASRTAKTTWTKLHKGKSLRVYSQELETQLEIFRVREGRDLSLIVEKDTDNFGAKFFITTSSTTTGTPGVTYACVLAARKAKQCPTASTHPCGCACHKAVAAISKDTKENQLRWMAVVQLLTRADLANYKDAFYDEGFDTIERVREMDAEDFSALKMKRGHAKSLRKALKTMTDAPVRPRAPERRPGTNATASLAPRNTSDANFSMSEDGDKASESDGPRRWSRPFGFKVIPHAALMLHGLIGRGSFGDVHLCEYQGGQCVAKKILRVPEGSEEEENPSLLTNEVILREAETMEMCKNHPHVVTLFGVCLDSPHSLLLISELCERGSLYEAVVQPAVSAFSLVQTLVLARQGVSGLVHLHSLDVVHRDIAARNFLLDSRGIVKVCDFGLAKIKPSHRNGSLEHSAGASRRVNPLRWAAPESLRDHEYSAASDVYMCGVFLWELWMRKQPFPHLDDVRAALQVIAGQRPHIDAAHRAERPELVDLCERCWCAEPAERPTMVEVLATLRSLQNKYSTEKVANPNAATPGVPPRPGHRYKDGL
ncbi:Protein kinase, putative [Hondaea fermentalgiana]|uniref:Protein kinase, putative n=1 Tax=Hondaea fermentalgiana TaxID=2315210 RepID=A0A2R5GSN5_9STRA|nr:Protein kinase, putative [Hondaea fermentalgiana]|eukprot:GBG33887.1 Protein kinase, putative [Hondaea fermentalgiana]